MSDSSVAIDSPEPPIAEPIASPANLSAAPAAPMPPETAALFDLIGRGFGPQADDSARTAAYEACQRIALALGVAPTTPAVAPMAMPAPTSPTVVPAATPPMVSLVEALRKLPREQLFDLAIARLRAALPAGASVAASDPVQFQLVPVLPSGPR